MTPIRRELFFRVMDGHAPLLGLLSIINKHPRCDYVLRWLIDHRYTGKTLGQWYVANFAPDPRKLFRHVYQNPVKPRILL